MKYFYSKHRDVIHMSSGVFGALILVAYFGMFGPSYAKENPVLLCEDQIIAVDGVTAKRSLQSIHDRLGDGSKVSDPINLKHLLESRRGNLRALMRENPEEAFQFIYNNDELKDAKRRTSKCVEDFVDVEGDVEVIHADYLDGTTVTNFLIRTSDGGTVQLNRRGAEQMTLVSGMHIRARGHRIGSEMLVNNDDPESLIEVARTEKHAFDWKFWKAEPAFAVVPSSFGAQNTIVILANFSDTSQASPTIASASSTIFGAVNNFYKENSYGKTSVVGNVVGYYKMPIARSCDIYAIQNAAIAAADPAVDFRNYSRIVIIAPMNCPGIAGYGSIGKWSIATADGTVSASVSWILSNYTDVRVVGHELGHNLGLHHAASISCGSGPITVTAPTGCTVKEYGDTYDIMGYLGHMNAPHKEYIGWFDAPYAREITTSGVYTVAPIEVLPTTTNPLSLRIKRSASPLDYLYAEYRQPILFDARFGVSSDGVKGALLHNLVGSNKTQLIDATANLSGTSLTLGKSFRDPATGASISLVAMAPEALTLNVAMGKTDFTLPEVTLVSPVSGSVASGTLQVTATASAASGIEKVEYWRSGDLAAFAVATVSPYTVNWNTRKAPNGMNWVYAVAYDRSGVAFGAPNNKRTSNFATVDVENVDAVFPTVKVTAPLSGTILRSPATISASASDNVGVYSVRFALSNGSMSTDFTSPYSYSATLATGTYTATALASDFVGNASTSLAVSFTVDNSPPVTVITSPAPNSFVLPLATTTITASVVDETSMLKGKAVFYVNNVQKCADAIAPFTCSWVVPANSTSTATTTYAIKVVGYDTAGNTRTTIPFNVYGQK